jgi:hypothetical protein
METPILRVFPSSAGLARRWGPRPVLPLPRLLPPAAPTLTRGKTFQTWRHFYGRIPLPASPETIVFYATDLTQNQKKKLNTLRRRGAAVSPPHQEAGFPSPTQAWLLKQFLGGLRRELGAAPERKRPLLAEDLREILLDLPDSKLGQRDRAVLLLGFTGAFRRSEWVALDDHDLEETATDSSSRSANPRRIKKGREDGSAFPWGADEASCPLWALKTWREVGELRREPSFG